jgi:hypothetical protein
MNYQQMQQPAFNPFRQSMMMPQQTGFMPPQMTGFPGGMQQQQFLQPQQTGAMAFGNQQPMFQQHATRPDRVPAKSDRHATSTNWILATSSYWPKSIQAINDGQHQQSWRGILAAHFTIRSIIFAFSTLSNSETWFDTRQSTRQPTYGFQEPIRTCTRKGRYGLVEGTNDERASDGLWA